jgi:hypothetical protein
VEGNSENLLRRRDESSTTLFYSFRLNSILSQLHSISTPVHLKSVIFSESLLYQMADLDQEDQPFASLTPADALTKLAFSDAYDALRSRRQNTQTSDNQAAINRMRVEPEQQCDGDIVLLRRARQRSRDNDRAVSESLTEPDTDTEVQLQELGKVWVGSYQFQMGFLPAVPIRGWRVGKQPPGNAETDLVLCTRQFAQEHNIDIGSGHAHFNFLQTNKSFYIAGRSKFPSAQLTVNGDGIARQPYHLNQHQMKIQFDKLQYYFKWTDYASTDGFTYNRKNYVNQHLNGASVADGNIEMPTPLPNMRTIGKWTLGRALGAGAYGKVSFATDQRGDMVAIKMVERTVRNQYNLAQEIQISKQVTELAKESENGDKILQMIDVLYPNTEQLSSEAFDNVAMVLTPVTPMTFKDLIGTRSMG